MNGESGAAPAFDLKAVGMGIIWGLVVLIVGSVVQGVVGFSTPLSPQAVQTLGLAWQAAAGLLGGFGAARRASGSGWLHGAVAGMALVLAVAAVMGVSSALPTLAVVLKMAGIGTAAGMMGGIAGVNVGRR
ncbi:MAG TPA: TIGR04086 family membrane protein [Symbiobacteriaceae bacterium]|jgi:putative membrane protein (TIGR04086 family)